MADPLSVPCPECGSPRHFECVDSWYGNAAPFGPRMPRNKPHVARVRAAQAAEKKEGDHG